MTGKMTAGRDAAKTARRKAKINTGPDKRLARRRERRQTRIELYDDGEFEVRNGKRLDRLS